MKYYLTIIAITFIAGFTYLAVKQPALATWDEGPCEYQECLPTVAISVDPTLAPTEEPTPEVTQGPTVVPTEAPTQTTSTGGDGKGDGRSDGLSSCPSCTKAPNIPAGPPATGRAL